MSGESSLPDRTIQRVLADLQSSVDHATGGASPRIVLAEVARRLASDLAMSYFDELPMHAFVGHVSRVQSVLRHFLPVRQVRHRVLLGRYVRGSLAQFGAAPEGYVRMMARIAILAVGSDGALRQGQWEGYVIVPREGGDALDALPWSDIRLRNVPPGALTLRDWAAGPDPIDVASPSQVVETLGELATRIAAESQRDLALLKRYL